MVAARKRLEGDQCGVVFDQNGNAVGSFNLGLAGTPDDALPAEPGPIEPVGQLDPAPRPPLVDDLGEGGGAPARGGQVRAGGYGTAFAAAVAEVDGHEGQAGLARPSDGRRSQGAGQAGQRPAVGRDQWMMIAGVGQLRSTGEAPGDCPGEAATGVDFSTGGDGRDCGEQEQGDQGDQSRLLDARRSTLHLPSRLHCDDARRDERAGGAQGVTTLARFCLLLLMWPMEGSPFNLFGDPDEFRARMEELSEQMQSSQRVAWADNAIKLAVEMTVASIARLELSGGPDEQAMQVRDAIRVLFPEAVTLVREAREGLS
ncbi:MAG: hypothetical protein QOF85_1180 [Solirubrobacterales bacterium]|nr:hypothetical protein [Solirubrobacterales bacterium]